jgi:hypothetical protein
MRHCMERQRFFFLFVFYCLLVKVFFSFFFHILLSFLCLYLFFFPFLWVSLIHSAGKRRLRSRALAMTSTKPFCYASFNSMLASSRPISGYGGEIRLSLVQFR